MEPLSKRVEVTLKTLNSSTASRSEINDLSNLHVGDIVSGRVKRVESYGLFITIDHTNLVRNKLLMQSWSNDDLTIVLFFHTLLVTASPITVKESFIMHPDPEFLLVLLPIHLFGITLLFCSSKYPF